MKENASWVSASPYFFWNEVIEWDWLNEVNSITCLYSRGNELAALKAETRWNSITIRLRSFVRPTLFHKDIYGYVSLKHSKGVRNVSSISLWSVFGYRRVKEEEVLPWHKFPCPISWMFKIKKVLPLYQTHTKTEQFWSRILELYFC